ncbi:phenylalanine--tRNA ligase subunit beta [Maribacter sp. 2307ULW6-5]|uniref:phenylalanine--tRNA ligase subunit beta n=1 Tax=Maribacter sp. 2307ULW6-5 TaxID=3386275 RepID=UPI0039BC322A
MKISYNWLKQFIKMDWDAQRTAELLTDLGLEVEGIAPFESVKGSLKGVVVGHVLECAKHPNADRLKLTQVDIGEGQPLQIVCGAPNVAKGQKVPVATVGTTLYTKDGDAWTIKKGKIRGEESHGMICAEDELGLGDGHDGIMVLDASIPVGTPCSQLFELERDEVFEIGLTPNRADAMSHFGVARDLKAGLLQQKTHKELITPSTSHFNVDNRSLKIDVDVANSALAPRYCGVTLSNLIIQPSPDWLKNRLRAIGITPKNNVVDATNYVMHELGQPLHAFDASKIVGGKVIVKTLPAGTKFTTLDGVERSLHQDDLMICNAEKPMCIAGVFGGIHSGVTEYTTAIFLESAYFDPVSVRQSAKRHGLNTDASFRFERGIDINLVEYSLKRAALLIKEIAGGEITSDIVDIYFKKKEDFEVFLAFKKIKKLIGEEIPRDTIKSILTSLEIKVKNVTEAGLGLVVPSYRVDVTRQVDVIEEILRVYGYNNIAHGNKLNASIAASAPVENHRLEDIVGNLLAAKGYYEILTNSLSSEKYGAWQQSNGNMAPVRVLNPLSGDLAVLRSTPVFSALEVAAHNMNRQNPNLKLFEFGKTYGEKDGVRQEKSYLSILLSGEAHAPNWNLPAERSNFFQLKSIVATVLQRLGIQNCGEHPRPSGDHYTEGLEFKHRDRPLVELGVVHPGLAKHFDIKQEVLFAAFHWDTLLAAVSESHFVYTDIPKYPEVKRDFALLLNEDISYKTLYDLAFKSEKRLLKQMQLFDVYRGNTLPEGKKSYAITYTLQNQKGTLTDKQIDRIMSKIQKTYESELGAQLR